MSLSVCLMTADPPSRVAAILAPLRPYAEEIVIAADARVDDTTLAGYDAVADRLSRIEFSFPERHMAWLYAQCHGDWILHLDGDEVPSQAFLRRLPRMLASREVQQFWIPTAWLFSDREHFLACPPWSTGFVPRLARNDGTLRFSGLIHDHAQPVSPREYVEEPFYHLELLISSEQERLDKVVRYEVARPHLLAAGGARLNEAFYLPELRDSLELDKVPEEDRAAIAQALDPSPRPTQKAQVEHVPFVSLAEMDCLWEGRAVSEDAYRARIELGESSPSLAPSEQRHMYFVVHNEGSEHWPAQLDAKPAIRLSYRWLDSEGNVLIPEGHRSAFTRPVEPKQSILTPLHVEAPPLAGTYLLEVDVVHEDVRWFDYACRVPIRVGQLGGLPSPGARLRESAPLQEGMQMRIPRSIHRVWVGGEPMPAEYERFGASFAEHNPNWEMRLWSEADLAELKIEEDERKRARTHSELSNLMRYEILRRYGGIYVDTDVECLRPLEPLLRGVNAFAALETEGRVGNAILGAVPGHRAFERAAQLARRTLGTGAHSVDANGPYLLSLILEQEPSVTIFAARLFYPYRWDEPERRHEAFPDAYMVHHWAKSWAGVWS
jgi:inositol phosphorylceramide mannosyltransferase catalytic subunit